MGRKATQTITPFSGQQSGLNRELALPGKGRLVYNFIVYNGVLEKIPGSELYLASGYGADPIVYLGYFQNRWIWQIAYNLVAETAESSQNEILLASDFDKDPIFSDEWRGRLYLANGKQLRFFDGSTVKELGLPPPGLGVTARQVFTLTDAGGGGSLGAGDYKYTLTFLDGNTDTESLPLGALVGADGLFVSTEFDTTLNPMGWLSVSITGLAANHEVIVSISAAFRSYLENNLPDRVTELRLYRAYDSGNGFGDYQFVTSWVRLGDGFNIASREDFTDTTAQANLGAKIFPEQLNPPPTKSGAVNSGANADETIGPKFIRNWRDQIWMFGAEFPRFMVTDSLKSVSQVNEASDAILYASDTFLPDYAPFNYEIGNRDGQKASGLGVASDTLCIFKERSIYSMLGSDTTNFVPKVIDQKRGCIAPGSLQETPKGIICLSDAGFIIFNGRAESELISKDIDDEVREINREELGKISSTYDSAREIYECHFPKGTALENNRTVYFNLNERAWSVGRAFNARSVKYVQISDRASEKMVGLTAGGHILKVSDGRNVADEGAAILARWRSAEIDFGEKALQKTAHWLYVTAACSVNFIIDVSVYSDYAQGPVFEATDIDSESDYATYASSQTDPDGAIYDTSRYSGRITQKKLKIPVEGIGRSFYVEVTEKENNTDRFYFQILAIELEASILGK